MFSQTLQCDSRILEMAAEQLMDELLIKISKVIITEPQNVCEESTVKHLLMIS